MIFPLIFNLLYGIKVKKTNTHRTNVTKPESSDWQGIFFYIDLMGGYQTVAILDLLS
jgi:hypothetical protein